MLLEAVYMEERQVLINLHITTYRKETIPANYW
jgi:hypothetical protein